jgi:RHS repeat-associated protein
VSGLPRELTGADGSVVWRAVYRAWGNTLRTEQAAVENREPVYQPLRYQGQYFDAETGLHYNRFRYYDPDAGRFVSHDPIGLAGGVNLYQYAPNPLSWIDPLGLSKCHLDNPKKKVNSAEIGDTVRTLTSHPENFIKVKGGDYKNNHTNEIWSKSNTSHSDKQGEWKVGIGKSAPKPRHKITIGMSDGKIIKVDKQFFTK